MYTSAHESTGYAHSAQNISSNHFLIVMDGSRPVECIDLKRRNKAQISFGRQESCDIRLFSPIVSGTHGMFELNGEQCFLCYTESLNGILLNGERMEKGSALLLDGASMRIDNFSSPHLDGVVMVYSSQRVDGVWDKVPLDQNLDIGRDTSCRICMSHPNVSRKHAEIFSAGQKWYIRDRRSTNGLVVNGVTVSGEHELREKDVFCIANAKFIYSRGLIIYNANLSGMALTVAGLCRSVKDKGQPKTILNNVSFSVKPREFVAVIGSSGAGKTTLINAACGLERADSGTVTINGLNLYGNLEALKAMIGYVPQQDIVHDGLTLRRMLWYTAKIRLPQDMSNAETNKLIDDVLALVSLTEEQNTLIRKLSGGERKRSSIAVELLANPGVFFLDEPTSGLDPHIVESLMHTLHSFSKEQGKTVIIITHTVQNIELCDKVAVMGTGGNLCFFGTPQQVKDFFEVEQMASVYRLASENRAEYSYCGPPAQEAAASPPPVKHKRKNPFFKQYAALFARYGEITLNDRVKMLLLTALPVVVALLFTIVIDKKEFLKYYDPTKQIVFAMACACIFIGLFTSIQEICKERPMVRREYFAGLRISAYMLSKMTVLFFAALAQGLLFTSVFQGFSWLPESGFNGGSAFIQVWFISALTVFVSSSMGLLISAIAKNGTFAMHIIPGVLIVQLLFSGVLFPLTGRKEVLSYITVSRWPAGLLGIVFNVSGLKPPPGIPELWQNLPMFAPSVKNIIADTAALCIIAAVCAVSGMLILRGVSRDKR